MSLTSNESIYFQETFKFVKTRRDVIKSYPRNQGNVYLLKKTHCSLEEFFKKNFR